MLHNTYKHCHIKPAGGRNVDFLFKEPKWKSCFKLLELLNLNCYTIQGEGHRMFWGPRGTSAWELGTFWPLHRISQTRQMWCRVQPSWPQPQNQCNLARGGHQFSGLGKGKFGGNGCNRISWLSLGLILFLLDSCLEKPQVQSQTKGFLKKTCYI